MKTHYVKHAKKPQVCGKCGAKIMPSRDEKQSVTDKRTGKTKKKIVRVLGDSYSWIKFNRGPKKIRCSKPACAFRASDKTGGKMSGVYAAQESAQDAIAGWDSNDVDDLKQILSDAAEEIKAVAEEYGESADNIEQAFTGGSATADECREKAEGLGGWADELEGVDFEEWDGPDEEEDACAVCETEIEQDAEGNWKHCAEAALAEEQDKDHDAEPAVAKNSNEQTREEWAEDQRNTAEEAIGDCPV
jgi:hypothetical protein